MPAAPDDLAPPVVLVTGASAGIGEAAARRFAHGGYRVALAARRIERLEALAAELQSQGAQALAVQADLSRLEDIRRLHAAVIENFGRLDVLVNNAGFGRLTWLEELEPVEDAQAQLEVNLLGLIWMTREALPGMIRRRRGHIINIGSLAGYIATPTYSVYAASKFGVRGFTNALRRETRIYGVRVTGIYPGAVATEFDRVAGIRRKTGIKTPTPLRLSADRVAEAIFRVTLRPRREVVLPEVMRFAIAIEALFPGFVDWAVEQIYVRPERRI